MARYMRGDSRRRIRAQAAASFGRLAPPPKVVATFAVRSVESKTARLSPGFPRAPGIHVLTEAEQSMFS